MNPHLYIHVPTDSQILWARKFSNKTHIHSKYHGALALCVSECGNLIVNMRLKKFIAAIFSTVIDCEWEKFYCSQRTVAYDTQKWRVQMK